MINAYHTITESVGYVVIVIAWSERAKFLDFRQVFTRYSNTFSWVVHQEYPFEMESKRTNILNMNVSSHLSVIWNTAKVDVECTAVKGKVGKINFTVYSDWVLKCKLKI